MRYAVEAVPNEEEDTADLDDHAEYSSCHESPCRQVVDPVGRDSERRGQRRSQESDEGQYQQDHEGQEADKSQAPPQSNPRGNEEQDRPIGGRLHDDHPIQARSASARS